MCVWLCGGLLGWWWPEWWKWIGNLSSPASHHWSELWALHPHLLQVTGPPHGLPTGLLTSVNALISEDDFSKYTFTFLQHMFGLGKHFSAFCSAHLPTSCLAAACNCQSEFTDGTCEDLTGRCLCKPNYTGENCDLCASGFIGFPECYRESQQKNSFCWLDFVDQIHLKGRK